MKTSSAIRLTILGCLLMATIVFAICEADTTEAFLASKAIAVLCGTLFYIFARCWRDDEVIAYINRICKE